MGKLVFEELSYKIIGLAMEVQKELGVGFLEKVYENSLMFLLKENNICAKQQENIDVYFHNERVGFYIADIIVEDSIILELKVVKSITNIHKAQLINYLKATNKKVGIILNFGGRGLEFQRVIF